MSIASDAGVRKKACSTRTMLRRGIRMRIWRSLSNKTWISICGCLANELRDERPLRSNPLPPSSVGYSDKCPSLAFGEVSTRMIDDKRRPIDGGGGQLMHFGTNAFRWDHHGTKNANFAAVFSWFSGVRTIE